jgi:hypothetical protein
VAVLVSVSLPAKVLSGFSFYSMRASVPFNHAAECFVSAGPFSF